MALEANDGLSRPAGPAQRVDDLKQQTEAKVKIRWTCSGGKWRIA